MLTSVRVQGFKAIFDSGRVRLGPLTVLVGRNGSGKSSLLESLQWLQESVELGLEQATAARFVDFGQLVNKRVQNPEIFLEAEFDAGTNETVYRLRVAPNRATGAPIVIGETCRHWRTYRSKLEIRSRRGKRGPAWRWIEGGPPVSLGDRLALRDVDRTDARGAIRVLSFLRRSAFLRLSPMAVGRRDLPARIAGSPLMDEQGQLVAALLEQASAAVRRKVADHVASVLDGVKDVDVQVNRSSGTRFFRLHERMRAKGGSRVFAIPAWLVSEGARRLTALFTLLAMDPRPALIAIEEIENGLDPWSLQILFSHLRKAVSDGVQILATTHSPFLLDNVEIDEVVHVTRVAGDTSYRPIESYAAVVRNKDVLAPGAMYLSNLLAPDPKPR